MCGIAGGMSSPLNGYEMTHIKNLMLMSCFRGMYGSGAIVVRPNNKKLFVDVHKTELCAAELAFDPDFIKSTNSPKIVVTHARAPTKGGDTMDFVHPHKVAHVTGVHNGTMTTVMGQSVDDKSSDSRAVFEAISQDGVEEFIKHSRGAYSLVWTDTKDGTLNFLRNDQRPMVFARIGVTDHATTMYFSSERGMLEYVLSQRGSISSSSIKYVSPKPWEHVRFSLDCKSGLMPLSLKQYEDPFKVPSYSYSGNHWGTREWEEYLEDTTGETSRRQTGQSVIPFLPPKPPEASTTKYRGSLRGHSEPQRHDPRFLPTVDELLSKRCVIPDSDKELSLIRSGSCVICETRPAVIGVRIPKIHPIKFGNSGVHQYICDDCVQKKNPIALSVLGATVPLH